MENCMQKLWALLATIYVEKKIWKKFWWGFRPIWVTRWKEFLISWKKWCFEIFRKSAESRASDPWFSYLENNYKKRKRDYLSFTYTGKIIKNSMVHQGYIHFASFIPERSPFYDMIRGYFDLRKIQLKVLQSQFSLFTLVNIDEIFQKNLFLTL